MGILLPCQLIAIFLLAFSFGSGKEKKEEAGNNRNKRGILTFPPDSVLQITMGISSAGDIERNHAAIVLALQQNAKLPNEPESFIFPSKVVSGRKLSVFHHLKHILISFGFNETECLEKMVCQIGEAPLGDGLLEDIISFVLSPSKHDRSGLSEIENFNRQSNNDIAALLNAEIFGKNGGNCSFAFPNCDRTPLDTISYLILP